MILPITFSCERFYSSYAGGEMAFISINFTIFFLVVLVLNWTLRPMRIIYRLFLLGACYFFYGAFNSYFLILLIHFSIWTWLLGNAIALSSKDWQRRSLLILNLIIGVGGLFFFKYYDLFFESFNHFFVLMGLRSGLPEIDIAVPVGISFFTFQGLSYSIDVFRKPQRLVKNPLDVFIFIAFFPTILSGPIMRAADLIPQIGNMRLDRKSSSEGFCLILSGLAKKLVLASYLSKHIVEPVFDNFSDYSSFCVALGVVGYSIQILCDFSGYTDIVRGVSLLMGYSTPQNFNKPYSATNLKEFWSRWHMSLSFWLRDYLYIPLGGNRHGLIRKYLNILLTMTIGGLWHGPHWNFLLWGVFHGMGISATHMFSDLKKKATRHRSEGKVIDRSDHEAGYQSLVQTIISWVSTFTFVTIGWVLFRTQNLDQAGGLLHRIFEFNVTARRFPNYTTSLAVFIIAAVLFHEAFRVKLVEMMSNLLYRTPLVFEVLVLSLMVGLLIRLGPAGIPEFIYYQF
jgi:alginate O-acetyltransferase complex protein AlgI